MSSNEVEAVFKRLRSALGLDSDRALAESLGMTYSAFAARKARQSLPRDEIDAMCEAAALNASWVYEGEGEMRRGGAEMKRRMDLLGQVSKAVGALSLDKMDAAKLQELLFWVGMGDREKVLPMLRGQEFVFVPRYDVQASAGPGTVVQVHDEAVVDLLAFRPDYLRGLGVAIDRIAVISVRGDSMAETLSDGDLILVDTTPPQQRMPGVYVLARDDSLLVKRLHFRVNGSVEVRSDNKAYPTETISAAEFSTLRIVGRMVRRVVR